MRNRGATRYLVGELRVVGEHLQERMDVLAIEIVAIDEGLYGVGRSVSAWPISRRSLKQFKKSQIRIGRTAELACRSVYAATT